MAQWENVQFGIEITGIKEAIQVLNKLPENIQKNVTRKAMRESMQPTLHLARSTAPRLTGRLLEGIQLRSRTDKKTGNIVVSVLAGDGWYRGKQFYASMVEFGHFSGKRPSKKKKTMRTAEGKFFVDSRKWVPAYPWMVPAYDKTARPAIELFGKLFKSGVDKQVKKLASKQRTIERALGLK